MNWATTNWTCQDCGTSYNVDLRLYCCSPWYDRSAEAWLYEDDMHEE